MLLLQPSWLCRLCSCMLRGRNVTSHVVFSDIVQSFPHGISLQQASAIQATELSTCLGTAVSLLNCGATICMRQIWCLRLHRPLLIKKMPARIFCVLYNGQSSFVHMCTHEAARVRPLHIQEAPQGLIGCKADAVLGNHFQRIGCPAPVEAPQALLLKAVTHVSAPHAIYQ